MNESALFDTESGLQLGIADYFQVLVRRKWVFVGVLLAGMLIGFQIVSGMPTLYQSTSVILLEAQEVPEELVESTVTTTLEERIDITAKRVLSRDDLVELAERFRLFPELAGAPAERVAALKERVVIERIASETGFRRNTVAFELAFLHEDPETAQAVANALTIRFLEESASARMVSTAETRRFLDQEAESIRSEIEQVEAEISEFKRQNQESLPERFSVNLAELGRVQQEYREVSTNLAGLDRELKFLQAQAEGAVDATSDEDLSATASLGALRARRAELLADLTPSHPDVVRVTRLIEAREAELAAAGESLGTEDTGAERGFSDNPDDWAEELAGIEPTLAREIISLRERIEFLRRDRRDLEARIVDLERRIAGAPDVERRWRELNRELDNLEGKYQDVQDKMLRARMAQSLEQEQKGDRFVLLEAAALPGAPAQPNFKLLYALVVAVSLSLGVLGAAFVEVRDPRLYNRKVIIDQVGATPLVLVPRLGLGAEVQSGSSLKTGVAVVAGLGIGLAVVHAFVMPLDELSGSVLRRLGLS